MEQAATTPILTFEVDGGAQGFIETARDILVRRIEERSSARCTTDNAAFKITLSMGGDSDADSFTIAQAAPGANTAPNSVTIRGTTPAGLLAGIGKFLRTSHYDHAGFMPSAWRGEATPSCDMRGMYFATHFLNWYHVAPETEIARYIEDLALWGVNHVGIAFPMQHLRGWDDPDTAVFFERFAMYGRICRRLGLRAGILCVPNHDFVEPRLEYQGTPNRDDEARKGDHGNNVCPNLPGATDYLLGNSDEFIRRLSNAPPDFVCFWPYDEGGCGCDACFPWGGNGFLKLCRAVAPKFRQAFPNISLILSTWVFDTPPAGEWEGLDESFKKDGNWVDYILADAHEDFPRYPLDVGVPGGVPLITFPEISMWGLGPWGGFGANPLPDRFQRLWNQVKHIVAGGLPYSEGIFEDVNKVIVSQFYWNPEQTADDTLREYTSYEFAGADIERVLELMRGIETNHATVASGNPPDLPLAKRMTGLADEIDGNLTEFARVSWRWRILYLRALLDAERYASGLAEGWPPKRDWGDILADNQTAQNAFRELVEIFHCTDDIDEHHSQHRWVRPPMATR